ncbi:MAG: class I SAM-dependent methyltransferase [Betaproteobacteria bacterium]|nr:class I SAM-dependent methyltransferase [Betaproteobacteria bacterium]
MSFSDAEKFWSERFSGEDYLFGTAPNVFLTTRKHLFRPGQRALSVADGEGRNSVWMASLGLEVTAIELSPVAVEKARKLAAGRGVSLRFVVGSVFDWAWPRQAFDVVAAIFVQFAAPTERARLFRQLIEALAPGGVLILQGYTPKQLEYRTGGPPHAENLYTEALLRESFGDLQILHLHEHEDVIREGKGHNGISALIDLVARKP